MSTTWLEFTVEREEEAWWLSKIKRHTTRLWQAWAGKAMAFG